MERLRRQCAVYGLHLSETSLALFDKYARFLLEENLKYNLTAVRDRDGVIDRHFFDSLTPLMPGLSLSSMGAVSSEEGTGSFAEGAWVSDDAIPLDGGGCPAAGMLRPSDGTPPLAVSPAALPGISMIPSGAKVIDVGCGAGLPGLPLWFVRPDIRLTLMDSTGKKCEFIRRFLADNDLTATVICARAEELAVDPDYRERYDLVVSRALAGLNVLAELTLPFVRPGGTLIAYKGGTAAEEAAAAAGAVKILGGGAVAVLPAPSTDAALHHALVRVGKAAPTPQAYPRAYGQIKRRPL